MSSIPNEVNITITAQDLTGPAFVSALAKMSALKSAARDAAKEFKSIGEVKVDPGAMTASLNTLKSRIQSLGIADIADVNVQPGRITVQLNLLKRLIQQAKIGDVLDINANMSDLQAQLRKISGITETIPIDFKIGRIPDIPKLGQTENLPIDFKIGQIPVLPKLGPTQNDGVGISSSDLARMQAGIDKLKILDGSVMKTSMDAMKSRDNFMSWTMGLQNASAAMSILDGSLMRQALAQRSANLAAGESALSTWALRKNMADLTTSVNAAAGGTAGGGGGGFWGLAAAAGAGGNAFRGWGGILRGTIGGIGLLHLAIDAVLEAIIAVGLASASAAVGILAMAPAAQDVYTNLKSIQTVNSALGAQIPPLTGQFDALAQSLAPQVIEAYGGGINILNKQTGAFGQTAHQVTDLVDTWVAKIGIWNNAQTGMGKLLQSGTGYLAQFGHILGTLGEAIAGLLRSDPGIAHFLLDFIGGLASLLNLATKLPGPLLEIALGLHGIFLWGSALGGVLTRFVIAPLIGMGRTMVNVVGPMIGLTQATGRMDAAFLGLSAVSWAWVGVAAAALGAFVYEMSQATTSAKNFVSGIETNLSSTSPDQLFGGITASIGTLNQKIQTTLPQIQGSFSAYHNAQNQFRADIKDIFDTSSWSKLASDIGGAGENIGKSLTGLVTGFFKSNQAAASVNLFKGEIVKLTADQVALATTTGGLISKGYSWSQTLAIMNLAGVRYNDSAAIQKQKVDNLITGYENLTGQGGSLANSIQAVNFAALQQQSQVTDLNSGWDAFITTITGGESGLLTFSDSLAEMAKAAAASGQNFGTLSFAVTASTTKQSNLTSTFQNALTNANAYADKLTLLASASGGGAQSTDLLNRAIMDSVALLLPAAKDSSTLTTELYALAQRGGFTGADSFKALSTWISNTKSPMADLNTITGTLTTNAGNLTTDVQNLSTALGVTLNNAMSTAIFQATGGQKFFNDFANAIVNTGVNSNQTKDSAIKLGGELMALLGNTAQAKQEFETLAMSGLHLMKQQADILWTNFAGPGAAALRQAGNNADNLHLNHFNPLKQSLFDVTTNVRNLGTSLFNLPRNTNVGVNMHASGSGQIKSTENILGQQVKTIGNLLFVAEGGKVTGGTPGRDSVLLAAMPGEVVVPTSMVNAGAVDHLRGSLPGFAGGGMVGFEHQTHAIPGWTANMMRNFGPASAAPYGTDVFNKFMSDSTAAVNKLIAAAQAAATTKGGLNNLPLGNGPLSSSAAVAQAFAKSILWAYGWGMNQWPFELALWNQESGWNAYAVNPSSGAYGIPQALGHGHPYNLGDYQAQIRWGDAYISTRYGNPQNAWAHEVANNWYDTGGWLRPGWNPPMYNGTGRPEHLTPDSGGVERILQLEVKAAGSSAFEQFMVAAIRKWVVIHGAGSVQKSFGRH